MPNGDPTDVVWDDLQGHAQAAHKRAPWLLVEGHMSILRLPDKFTDDLINEARAAAEGIGAGIASGAIRTLDDLRLVPLPKGCTLDLVKMRKPCTACGGSGCQDA